MIESEFTIEDATVLVAIRSGHIAVEQGDVGMVTITVDTSDSTFEVRRRGDAIVASGERGGRAYVTARVPAGAKVELSSASGDMRGSVPLDRLDASTASGDLTFDTVERLQVKTASGDVKGESVTGEARAITASGSISITRVLDRADLSAASGDITIGEASGSLSCATLSGDIRVGRIEGPSLDMKTMSGTVRVGVPAGTRLELDASSLTGKIGLPTASPSPKAPEREVSIKARLVSGDLRIDRA